MPPILLALFTNRLFLQSLFIGALVASVWYYVHWNRTTIERLRQNNAVLEVSVQQQQKVISNMERDFKQIVSSRDRLTTEVIRLQKQRDDLRETLFRETQGKKGLEELARAKPGLIERAINSGTRDVFKCVQILSEGGEC